MQNRTNLFVVFECLYTFEVVQIKSELLSTITLSRELGETISC
jgi:hypothetical protein